MDNDNNQYNFDTGNEKDHLQVNNHQVENANGQAGNDGEYLTLSGYFEQKIELSSRQTKFIQLITKYFVIAAFSQIFQLLMGINIIGIAYVASYDNNEINLWMIILVYVLYYIMTINSLVNMLTVYFQFKFSFDKCYLPLCSPCHRAIENKTKKVAKRKLAKKLKVEFQECDQ